MGNMGKKSARGRAPQGHRKTQYRVFVSHATADKWIATQVCKKIEAIGVTTFRDDRDVNGGDDIPAVLRKEIRSADELVVLLTPDSVGRSWVDFEIGAAWGVRRNFRIVGILYHTPADSIPDIIRNKKAIKLDELDTYISELRRRATQSGNG